MHRLLSKVGFIAMGGGLAGLVLARQLFSSHAGVIVLQGAAAVLMVWARITFGRRSFHLAADPTAGGLVTSGPYRFVRHPIYSSVCLFVWAGVAGHWSWLAVLLAGLVTVGALVRIFCEETLLVAQFPEYPSYAAQTKRVIPYLF